MARVLREIRLVAVQFFGSLGLLRVSGGLPLKKICQLQGNLREWSAMSHYTYICVDMRQDDEHLC
jgi:heme oxygenase